MSGDTPTGPSIISTWMTATQADALTTHAADAVPDLDVYLAGVISPRPHPPGRSATPSSTQTVETAVTPST